MRQEKLNFGIIIRSLVSLLPYLIGLPTLAMILCSYNILMSFIVFGPLTAIVSSLSSACVAMLIGSAYGSGGELAGFVLAIQAILASTGCIYGYLVKKRFSMGLTFATCGVLLPQFIYIQHLASSKGLSVAQAVVPSVEDIKAMFSLTVPELNTAVLAPEIEKIAYLVNKFTTLLVPSVFIISSMVLAYIVIWAISVQLRKLPVGIHHSFSAVKIPKFMTLVLLLSGAFLFTYTKIQFPETVFAVALNMFVVLISISLFSGISLFDFFLRKRIKITFLRVIIIAGVLFFTASIAFFAFAFAACLDSFLDFRKITLITPAERGDTDETEK